MSLAKALEGLKEAQALEKPPKEARKPRPAKPPSPERMAEAAALALAPSQRVRGKSANPEYEKVTIYTRRDLRRAAERKFEDEGGRDLSDLIEGFLLGYLNR